MHMLQCLLKSVFVCLFSGSQRGECIRITWEACVPIQHSEAESRNLHDLKQPEHPLRKS